MLKQDSQKKEMQRRNVCLKLAREKFVIYDGTDDPYISTKSELNGDVSSILKLFVDMAESDLLQDDEENPSEWRRVLVDVINGKPKRHDDEWWIRIYLISDSIADEWNSYCDGINYPEDKINFDSDKTIRKVLWLRGHTSLLEFIDSRYGVYESYYVPEKIIGYKRIQKHL